MNLGSVQVTYIAASVEIGTFYLVAADTFRMRFALFHFCRTFFQLFYHFSGYSTFICRCERAHKIVHSWIGHLVDGISHPLLHVFLFFLAQLYLKPKTENLLKYKGSNLSDR